MSSLRRLLLSTWLLGASLAWAAPPGHAVGLPLDNIPVNQLYGYSYGKARFLPVASDKVVAHYLYVKFNAGLGRWTWVSGDDYRPLTSPSKVQGFRLGVPHDDKNLLDWFKMEEGDVSWTMTTDSLRPREWRYTDQGRKVIVYTAADGWMKWGGKVDGYIPPAQPMDPQPLPKPEPIKPGPVMPEPIKPTPTPEVTAPPGCTLTVEPSPVVLGRSVKLKLITRGDATRAVLNGKPAKVPLAELDLMPEKAGTFTVTATVEGPGGKNNCWAEFRVDAVSPLPDPNKNSCSITLEPATLKVGESTVAVMTVEGEFRDATLEGVNLIGPTGIRRIGASKAGKMTVTGEVRGAKNDATCSADAVVTP